MLDRAIPIPTVDEIRASTHILSAPDASATVVKLRDGLAAKFGRGVTLLEAESMAYVGAHSDNNSVPVPRVYAAFTERETGTSFIVMDFVPGRPLGAVWAGLTGAEKLDVGSQVRAAVEGLRRMEAPGFLGAVGRRALPDGVFVTGGKEAAVAGPFETEEEFNEAILRRLAETEPAAHLALLRTLISRTLNGHRTVFTHGDLRAKNILVHRTGVKPDGSGSGSGVIEIKIVDWEMAGWYPEYWEFCSSTVAGRFFPDWLELAQRVLDVYPEEYLMMQMIRSILFY
ncbi:uncharacterized protein K452DRAFT_129414 [Aplosporella prunicola CBS 121167]|uniref:Aminoglycoside phosphotransferase domain-containing protein n=1 Tax=Aplosporella prunicola CBS 121167 TaxID=1176127 RepID=A0A6A6AWY7_9PEZI|nr:uncharacterized protein K452DRAFT_129414 [Aplosporella prunicola CBS 121167]KAF2136502.1 hypothetical protein K452DRAFT_129414 [Aplosporella prunicola CBS 121167]